MTPAQIEDAVSRGVAAGVTEATRQVTDPKRTVPPPWYKRAVPAATALAAVAGAVVLVWAFLGDYFIIPRAEADKVHVELRSDVDKNERAGRHQVAVSKTLNENLITIGQERGLPMKALPQPDLFADD